MSVLLPDGKGVLLDREEWAWLMNVLWWNRCQRIEGGEPVDELDAVAVKIKGDPSMNFYGAPFVPEVWPCR